MHNDLIERYIFAVSKQLPYKIRNDIGKELHGIIADMLEARCGELPPSERDVRMVLTELGSPAQLAEKYNPDKQKYLIGPGYYTSYKQLLRIILPTLAFGLILSFIIISLLGGHEQPLPQAMWQWLGMLLSSCMGVFASLTILFAFFERRGIRFDIESDDLNALPPLPQKDEQFSRWEIWAGVTLNILFCVVFLAAPQIMGWYVDGGNWSPVFNIPVLRNYWPLLVFMTLFGLVREASKLVDGRYTRRVAFASILADALTALMAIAIFSNATILNPTFLQGMRTFITEESNVIQVLFDHFNLFFLGIFLFAVVLDIGTVITRTLRAQQAEQN